MGNLFRNNQLLSSSLSSAKKNNMYKRKYPIGAEMMADGGVHFRVWAPDHSEVSVVLEQASSSFLIFPMQNEQNEYFSLLLPEAKEGSLYYYQLASDGRKLPDPASRFQPSGPYGPSCVINPVFPWTDELWLGAKIENQIIYEMHIGTYTEQGTFAAAIQYLDELAHIGITLIEIMPINEFPGSFGWGYDGVNLFAPYHRYGHPDDVKNFINRAHALGMGVILDVVYNHFGPEGNFIGEFSQQYFNPNFSTDWGSAINFNSIPSKQFFLTNARYWIEEYHFDGLRIDDTSKFFCETEPHILVELVQIVKKSGNDREIIVIAENETQDTTFLHSIEKQGYGFDGLWNDDFHHTALARLQGRREAYYMDYLGTPQEFISLVKYGFIYQGQYYNWQKKNRGIPDFNLSKKSLVIFLENHDQVGNSLYGHRLHQGTDAANFRVLTCLLLLSPQTPMLFQGQEYGSDRPFLYFADQSAELSDLINKGRRKSLGLFPRFATEEAALKFTHVADPAVFESCKLTHSNKSENFIYHLHKDLIRLRKNDAVFKTIQRISIDGAVLGVDSFLIRYFGGEQGDRLLLVNFGTDYTFSPAPEPLLALGINLKWEVLWSSESILYGGAGTSPLNTPHWQMIGHSAIVLKSVPI